MGDAGEGLVDAESRLAERMEEREQEKRKARQAANSGDPERARQLESLRLARTEMQRQLDVTTHEARKQQLGQAIAELDRRIKELSKSRTSALTRPPSTHSTASPCRQGISTGRHSRIPFGVTAARLSLSSPVTSSPPTFPTMCCLAATHGLRRSAMSALPPFSAAPWACPRGSTTEAHAGPFASIRRAATSTRPSRT